MEGFQLSPDRQENNPLPEKKGINTVGIGTIPRRTQTSPCQLSFAQARLWFLNQLEPDSPLYNALTTMRLKGSLNIAALAQSFNEIVRRHEALRTTFVTVNGQPVQIIAPTLILPLPVVNLQELPEIECEAEVLLLATEEGQHPFNLARGPLLRVTLLQLGQAEHVLLFTIHHIVSDGWSVEILVREVATLYGAFCSGKPSPLPELPIQYADFAVWQREWLQPEVLAAQLAYWQQQLGSSPPVLQLPTDHSRPAIQSFRGATQSLSLPIKLTKELKALSRQERVTLFMTLLAAFKTLLYRYTNQDDILVGAPIANRNQAEIQGLIGFFLNTLVLRTYLGGNPSFRELLSRVRKVALEGYAHQDMPFEVLVEVLQPERDLSRNPLFQVMFNMLNFAEVQIELPGLTVEPLPSPEEIASKFDLSLYALQQNEGIQLKLVYNTDLFEQVQIVEMLGHFRTLLENIIANPEQPIATLPLLTEAECYQRSIRCNLIRLTQPFIKFKKEEIEQSICARFEEQVRKYPKNIAIKTKKYEWTYESLNVAANQVAQTVLSLKDSSPERVALLFEHDAPGIAGILGILKAGKTYVPLDPSYPQERLAYILTDSQASVILTNNVNLAFAKALTLDKLHLINIDEVVTKASGNTNLAISPETIAYILYTSGSTGQPKGVFQNHRNLLHHTRTYINSLHISPQDQITLFSSYSFDAAIMDIFGALLSGATLYPINIKEEGMVNLYEWLIQQEITIYHSTPTVYRYFVNTLTPEDKFPKLRLVVLGGEEVFKQDIELYKKYFDPQCILINGLGPTESTLSLQYFLNKQTEMTRNSVPVGYPVDETEILLLNQAGEQVAVYGIGEIAIISSYLALGYWQKPEMTQAVFLDNPHLENRRIYQTGDMGRLLPDGSIEFVGRKDFQVKIRGYRIEVSEIQTQLLEITGVKEAVVVAREEVPGDKRLVAYLVPQEAIPTISELRHFLKQKLPEYMVPSAFVILDALPLTPNGKVDRRLLPAPDISHRSLEVGSLPPRTPTEQSLAAIWTEVLGLEQVGIHDNFFELGGHSLLATQVISRLRETFSVELPLRYLFEFPTVAELSESIETTRQGREGPQLPAIKPVSRDKDLPPSFAQARLWFLDQLERGSAIYNIPAALRLIGSLHISALEQSLTEILRRHEALRTTFGMVNGSPVQTIATTLTITLPVVDLQALPAAEQSTKVQQLADEEAQRPFNLADGPLLRVTLLHLGQESHVLLLTMHHIVADGWSIGILIREVAALYEAFCSGKPSPLPELPIQYADFAIWQREWLPGKVLESHLSYWKQQLGSSLPMLQLPTDRLRTTMRTTMRTRFASPVQTFDGARRSLLLPKPLSESLKALSQQEGGSLFMTLLAAFKTLLSRYTGQEDIIVGSPIAGRNRAELEGLIGFFVNTLVLRTDLSGNPSFRELLTRVREMALGAYTNQDLPFEKLVEELQPERDLSHTPLFQVFFNQLNFTHQRLELPGLTIEVISTTLPASKFDLTLYVREPDNGIHFELVYNANLFRQDRMVEMLEQFQHLLWQIVEKPEEKINHFSLVTSTAKVLLPNPTEALHSIWEEAVHTRFSQQAQRVPERLAIADTSEVWSYAELDSRSNQLANYLHASGIQPQDIVAIYGHRSASLVLALLGVLKAGAAFVILDPTYPALCLIDRLRVAKPRGWLQLEAAGVLPNALEEFVATLSCCCRFELPQQKIAAKHDLLKRYPIDAPEAVVGPDDLAYVAFTSGTTGVPKGILGGHRPLSHFLQWHSQTFNLNESDRFSMLSGLSHDPLLRDIFTPLWLGATLCIPDPEDIGFPDRMTDWMKQQEISIAHLTPAMGQLLSETTPGTTTPSGDKTTLTSLRYTFFSGDVLTKRNVSSLQRLAPSVTCVNFYGATETPQAMGYFVVPDRGEIVQDDELASLKEIIPLGRGIKNVQLLILNTSQQLAGVGEMGEIYVRTSYLAKGYMGDDALTQDRFIINPLTKISGDRLYNTGDLGRYLPDGNVEFCGRIDHQVKIRGFRIELSEIEAVLGQHPAVQATAVIAREDVPGDKRLVAYLIANQRLAPAISELRYFLKEKLPEYMVPSAFVLLDVLPLTPNGKVDRRNLPAPGRVTAEQEETFVAPRTPVEERLAEIWAQLLGVEPVGIHDNFFELGGHSLLATKLISRVCETFQVQLLLRSLFEAPTVAGLSVAIAKKKETDYQDPFSVLPMIEPALKHRHLPFPLTDIQQAYWIGRSDIIELGNVASHRYFEFESSKLDLQRFNLTWQRLVDRHDMLRAIVLPDGQQQILPKVPPYQIESLDFQGQEPQEIASELETVRQRMSHQVLATDQWPLFDLKASCLENQRVRLHFSFDYLIADAWSFRILIRELFQLYQNPEAPLAPLELSFRDYVLAEIALQDSELYRRSQDYWWNRLPTLPAAPELPLAQNPSSLTHPRFVRQSARLEPETWLRLKTRAIQAGLTPSGVLLAAFAEILAVWSKNPRFTIVLTLFNRLPLHPQVNNIVGDFTSTTLLAVDSSQDTFAARACRIQDQLWNDLDHRYVNGVRVLRELARLQRGASRAAMPVVFTSTLNLAAQDTEISPIALQGNVVYSISQTPQVFLDHQVSEQAGALIFTWDVVAELFPEGLLQDMFGAYCNFLHRLADEEKSWQETARQLIPPAQLEQRSAINETEAPIPQEMLHTLFAAQVPQRLHACAVVSSNQTLTYQQLYCRANQVAHRLRQLGARPNRLVAIAMEKGWEQVVAVLGVLQSGAAYLPLDPGLPQERLWHLLEQGEVQLVLTQSWLDSILSWPEGVQRVCVDTATVAGYIPPLEPVQTPTDLAYVIYTSGSTGLPKGVMIDHRGAVNTILDLNQRFGVSSSDRVLALCSLSFDLSVYDIFGTLAAGGTIVIPEATATKDPACWLELMVQHQVTLWNSVPALMQMLVEYVAGRPEKLPLSMRLALLSGDWIPLSLPDQIKALWKNVQVVSLGGATEASIWSIFYPIEAVDPAWKSIPYGQPLTNQRFYVFNELLEPCPVWVPGELYIGGVGLAKGYWQDQDKTRVSFLTHPRTGERLYHTGDLGRYIPDGNIEFLGREDFQVKLQGHRIELGEIEAALAQHPAVRAAVVAAIGKSANSRRLVAYLVCDQESASSNIAAGDAPFQQLDGVLLDPVQRLEFKLKKPGLRADHNELPFTQLVKPKFDQSLLETYFTRRRSHRRFLQESIAFEQFSQFLSCMMQLKVDGAVLPKSRYGSAGGLYPIQLYLYIKPERVEGLAGGTYYYNPQEHRLVLISAGAEVDRNAHGLSNRNTFDESAFSLFLVGQLNAITPMYGNKARDFCLIEAGLISQLLETSAPDYNLGLCQIGGFDFDQVRHLLALDAGHEYLYSLLGGRAEDAENGMFFENSSPVLSSQELQDRQSEAGGLSLRYASLHRSQVKGDFSAQIKIYLKEKLPEYMVPSAFVLLDALPLTPNGKVDRNALPEPDEVAVPSEVSHIAPHSEVEQTIAAIWKQVLQLDKVGVHDNFFDLGGNSVHIVRIHSKLQEVFHKKIAMVELFGNPTISSLATVLSDECR